MRLTWDNVGDRLYETGVKKGVLYLQSSEGLYPSGVVWNGLTAISESPSGAEPSPLYADDIKYLNLISNEEFGASIEAYTYPEEFEACDGSASLAEGVTVGQQRRQPFGLSYVTTVGNDVDGIDHGYKIHLVYGCLASPSEKSYATINDSPEAITFSWEVSTTPVAIGAREGKSFRPTSTLIIDSTKVDADTMFEVENILYGGEMDGARLPLPDELIGMMYPEDTEG